MCTFLIALDVLVLWTPVTEHMDMSSYDRPARISSSPAHLAVGVPATQEAWRSLWLEAGFVEQEPGKVNGQRQFSMTEGLWQVQPDAGPLLEVTTRKRRVTRLINADSQLPVAGWNFSMPPLALISDPTSLGSAAARATDLPIPLIEAIVQQHDPTFFEHRGLNLAGSAEARIQALRGQIHPDPSPTITQQVAHSMFTRSDTSWQRRGQEVMISLLLEHRYEKREILEAWINNCTFVSQDGVIASGILAASNQYFGKDLAELNKADVKVLAASIRPFHNPSPVASSSPAPPRAARSQIPWLLSDLQEQLQQRFPQESLHRDGLELRTTIHPILQEAAARNLQEGLAELRAEHPDWWQGDTGPHAALIAMDPRTGAIRAMASSATWKMGAANPATERLATAGTAFKPIVLAAAIGADWPHLGPQSEVLDEPISIDGSELPSSSNEDGTFLGPVSLRTATERSRKPPFIRLGMKVGPKRLVETARALGIASSLRPRLSLSLGEQRLTLMDLCTAYATIANAGTRPQPRLLDGLRGAQGNWLERSMPDSRGAIDPRVASVVTTLLKGVVERGTAHRVRDMGFRLPLAANPGLSQNRRDAWMIGFTPDLVVGLWIGSNASKGLQGASEDVAVRSWTRFLLEAEPFLEGGEFRHPPGAELAGKPSREHGTSGRIQQRLRDEDRARRLEEDRALQLMDQGTL